jgi:hypothetical protein
MRQRLPLAISLAALVVAVLGSTSLGEAARDGVTRGVSKAKQATGLSPSKSSARRGPRGPRGYRGRRGPRGFQGPPGDRGDPGPSNGYEAQWTTPVAITGVTPETATIVKSTAALPTGKYAVTAEVSLTGSGAKVYCRGRGPGPAGPYLGQAGVVEVSTVDGTITLTFGADLAAGGTVSIACWQPGVTGADAGPGDIVAVKVGDLTAAN